MVAIAFATGNEQDLPFNQSLLPSGEGVIGELVSAIHTRRSGWKCADRLFEAHILRALACCVAGTKDGLFLHKSNKGGLALWQIERAMEILEAGIGRRICLTAVARECGLTAGHFARAFRVSTGVAPSQWLVNRRIAMAKTLLSTTPKKLSEVALDCGFADQSHFTQVFSRHVGVSPGRWRAALPLEPPLTSTRRDGGA